MSSNSRRRLAVSVVVLVAALILIFQRTAQKVNPILKTSPSNLSSPSKLSESEQDEVDANPNKEVLQGDSGTQSNGDEPKSLDEKEKVIERRLSDVDQVISFSPEDRLRIKDAMEKSYDPEEWSEEVMNDPLLRGHVDESDLIQIALGEEAANKYRDAVAAMQKKENEEQIGKEVAEYSAAFGLSGEQKADVTAAIVNSENQIGQIMTQRFETHIQNEEGGMVYANPMEEMKARNELEEKLLREQLAGKVSDEQLNKLIETRAAKSMYVAPEAFEAQ